MGGTQFNRHSIRMPGVDYSAPGFYFVTICTKGREHMFGKVVNGEMVLNKLGKIVESIWDILPKYFVNCVTDAFQIMPNHIHGIIIIADRTGAVSAPKTTPHTHLVLNIPGGETPPLPRLRTRPTLGQIVAYFKYQTTKLINVDVTNSKKIQIWQRNYYEHVIRNESSLNKIRQYIRNNPWKWDANLETQNNPPA